MNLPTLAIAAPGSSLYEAFLARARAAEGCGGGVELAEPTLTAGVDYCATCGADTTLLRQGQCAECR